MGHLQNSHLHSAWKFDSVRHRKRKAVVEVINNMSELDATERDKESLT